MFNARRALSVSFTLAELPHDGFRPLYTALYIENKSCNTLLFYDALGLTLYSVQSTLVISYKRGLLHRWLQVEVQ